MKVVWLHDLPTPADLRDSDLEGPLGLIDGTLWFGTADYAFPANERARFPERRAVILSADAIDARSGQAHRHEVELAGTDLPSEWTFLGGDLFHCGPIVVLGPNPTNAGIPDMSLVASSASMRIDPTVYGNRLIVADASSRSVIALDLESVRPCWSRPIGPPRPYKVGEATAVDGLVACPGADGLELIDPATGLTVETVSFPQADVLYSPISIDDDVVVGYTNWSTGGLIRYERRLKRIVWRFRARFQGPAARRRIWLVGGTVVWVKGQTSLIGIDVETGEKRWVFPTTPYLYSRVSVVGGDLVFGTSGRGGSIHVVNAETGRPRWSRELANGCMFYALHDSSVLVGDFEGFIRQLDFTSGREVDRLDLGSPIVGDITAVDGLAYTVTWPTDSAPARVVGVQLDA